MTLVSAVDHGSYKAPAYYPDGHAAADYNGMDYSFVCADDLLSPSARVLANPAKLVRSLVSTPVTVPTTAFGLHVLSTGVGALPAGMTAGYLRSHDSAIWWCQIATADGVYSWGTMDAWVSKAEAIGAKPIYTIFGTPNWCSSSPAQNSSYPGKPGIAAPPTSIVKLTDFLGALLSRYGSRIKHFEVWNEVNILPGADAAYWSGTNAQLLDILVASYDTIKAAIPSATIISPSTQGWGQGLEEVGTNANNPSTYLGALLTAKNTAGTRTLASACDLIGMHSYYPDGLTRNWQGMYQAISGVLAGASVTKGIFDTETGLIDLSIGADYSDEKYLRLLKQNMLCAASLGIQGQCWYAYDHDTMGFKARQGVLTGYMDFANLLSGATINSCLQYKNGSMSAMITKNGQSMLVTA